MIDVVFNAEDNRVTVSINITDDNDDEGDEAFGLVLKRTDGTPNAVQIRGPTTAFGIIEDNDEPGTYILTNYICSYVVPVDFMNKFKIIGVRFQSNSSTAAESAGSISFQCCGVDHTGRHGNNCTSVY